MDLVPVVETIVGEARRTPEPPLHHIAARLLGIVGAPGVPRRPREANCVTERALETSFMYRRPLLYSSFRPHFRNRGLCHLGGCLPPDPAPNTEALAPFASTPSPIAHWTQMKADLIVEFWRRETDLGVCKEKLGRDAGLLDPIPTTFRRPETDHHHRYSHALKSFLSFVRGRLCPKSSSSHCNDEIRNPLG